MTIDWIILLSLGAVAVFAILGLGIFIGLSLQKSITIDNETD